MRLEDMKQLYRVGVRMTREIWVDCSVVLRAHLCRCGQALKVRPVSMVVCFSPDSFNCKDTGTE